MLTRRFKRQLNYKMFIFKMQRKYKMFQVLLLLIQRIFPDPLYLLYPKKLHNQRLEQLSIVEIALYVGVVICGTEVTPL